MQRNGHEEGGEYGVHVLFREIQQRQHRRIVKHTLRGDEGRLGDEHRFLVHPRMAQSQRLRTHTKTYAHQPTISVRSSARVRANDSSKKLVQHGMAETEKLT